jgi:hypothetical protein
MLLRGCTIVGSGDEVAPMNGGWTEVVAMAAALLASGSTG